MRRLVDRRGGGCVFRGADSPLSVIGQVVGQVAARRYGAVGYWKWERYAHIT